MGDEEGMWGKPSQFFIGDKPLDMTKLSDVELRGAMRGGGKSRTQMEMLEDCCFHELDLNVEIPQFQPFETIFPQEESENVWDWTSKPITLNFTIDAKSAQGLRKLVRCPRLPRKLKKYVKKHYFDEYPKHVSAQMLRFAFAINNPAKAGKVGLHIGVDVANDTE